MVYEGWEEQEKNGENHRGYLPRKFRALLGGVSEIVAPVVALTTLYLVVGGVVVGLRSGLDVAIEHFSPDYSTEHEISDAKLLEKKVAWMMQTKGHLQYGIFELPDGRQVRVSDGARPLEGKLFDNSVINRLEEGKLYNLDTIGSERWGHTALAFEESH
jgi:hypothetical protein